MGLRTACGRQGWLLPPPNLLFTDLATIELEYKQNNTIGGVREQLHALDTGILS